MKTTATEPASNRVIRAARALFLARGFDGVSVDEIARQARVSKPTIYSHFNGKAGLFVSILEQACQKLTEPLLPGSAAARPIAEVLHEHARQHTRAVLTPEVIALHRLFIAEAPKFPELSRRYFAMGPQVAYDVIGAFLAERAGAKEIVCADPASAARYYAALVVNPCRMRLLFMVDTKPDWREMDRLTRDAVAFFLSALKAI